MIEEGTRLVEELLKTWASQQSCADGEDIVMSNGADDDPEAQLQQLRHCFDQFRPELEQNLWVRRVLASLA